MTSTMFAATLLLAGYGLSWLDLGWPWTILLQLLLVLLIAKLSAQFLGRHERKPGVSQEQWKMSTTYRDDAWINKLIAEFWPSVMQYVTKIVEKQALDNLGRNFKLNRITLGSRPICIQIKRMWSIPARKEVVIYFTIEYESDCKISFSWMDLPGNINDLSIRGLGQLVLGPISNSPPFVSNFHFKFSMRPVVDYHLSGIAIFLEIFGLRNRLESYLATMVINHDVTEKKTSEYDRRASNTDDTTFKKHISTTVHESKAGDCCNFKWLFYSLLALCIFFLCKSHFSWIYIAFSITELYDWPFYTACSIIELYEWAFYLAFCAIELCDWPFYTAFIITELYEWAFYIAFSIIELYEWAFYIAYSAVELCDWPFYITFIITELYEWTFYIAFSTIELFKWPFYIAYSITKLFKWPFYIAYSIYEWLCHFKWSFCSLLALCIFLLCKNHFSMIDIVICIIQLHEWLSPFKSFLLAFCVCLLLWFLLGPY